MTRMLSSPYPVPNLRGWQASMSLAWLAGLVAGTWVIVSPPLSYDGLGLALTTAWGAMLATGSGLCLVAHLFRRYQIELPGLALALGGIVIYAYLSWQQTLTGSLGSGPRACLLILLALWIVARARALIHLDGRMRDLIGMRGDDG